MMIGACYMLSALQIYEMHFHSATAAKSERFFDDKKGLALPWAHCSLMELEDLAICDVPQFICSYYRWCGSVAMI